MAALRARHGVVADLVRGEAEAVRLLRRGEIEGRRLLALRQGEFAARVLRREARARFDGELVEREVVRRQREGPAQFGAPGGLVLAWPRVDQVEGQARKCLAGEFERGHRLARIVPAAEEAQRGLVKRLHAERAAIHPRVAEGAQPRRLHAGRVRLQRDLDPRLGPRLDVKQRAGVGEQRGHRLRFHEGGRAAAEEHAGQPPPADLRGRVRQFPAQCRAMACVVRPALAHVGVEVAIRALGGTEWPVDVERERLVARVCQIGGGVHAPDMGRSARRADQALPQPA